MTKAEISSSNASANEHSRLLLKRTSESESINNNEEEDYEEDPHAFGKPINWLQCLAHLLRGNMGTGMLSMPYAFYHAGIVGGPLFMLFLSFISVYCMNLLLRANHYMCKRYNFRRLDYGNLSSHIFQHCHFSFLRKNHKVGKNTVNIFLILTQLGFCTAYFTFISTTLQEVLKEKSDNFVRITDLVLFIPILGLCLIRSLSFLAILTFIANVLLLLGTLIIFEQLFVGIQSPTRLPAFASPLQWPIFYGNAIYSVEGIGLVLPLENQMKKPHQFPNVLNFGLTFAFGVFILFGFMGYDRYGSDVLTPISLNLGTKPIFDIVKIMFAISMYISYAIQFYVPVYLCMPWIHKKFEKYGTKILREYAFRTILVALTAVAAAAIPQLGLFVALVGSVASTMLALILPAFLHLLVTVIKNKEYPKKINRVIVITDYVIVVFGILCGIMGTTVAIMQIVDAYIPTNSSPLMNATTVAP